MALFVRHLEARLEAVATRRSRRKLPAGRSFPHDVRETAVQQIAKDTKQLGETLRRVPEAEAAAVVDVAVARNESVEEPLEIQRVPAQIARRQVPLSALAELREQTR